jgi:hypothetical protein
MNRQIAHMLLAATLALPVASASWAADATAPAAGGVKSANIFDVKPDASEQPGYAGQNNGERSKVQPGNNAPMWRQVGAGVTGFSSLPHSQAPEAGNLIQPFVQYPGSSLTNAGEAWRQVRNNWILPYGGSFLLIVLLALGIFYKTKGQLGGHLPDTGRKIERFTPFERAAHWANAGGVHCACGVGHHHGIWQIFHPAGHWRHAVRLADLCPEKPAQILWVRCLPCR